MTLNIGPPAPSFPLPRDKRLAVGEVGAWAGGIDLSAFGLPAVFGLIVDDIRLQLGVQGEEGCRETLCVVCGFGGGYDR